MNSEIIVTRQVISLIDKYLKHYPMDQYYDNDQTTYLKTVNTYFSVSILEKYRNRLKKLKKDLQRGRISDMDLHPDIVTNQITNLKTLALRYTLVHSLLDYMKADQIDRVVIGHSWYLILKMKCKTLLKEANFDIEYLKIPFENIPNSF
jgi:hypothetical protein|nr:MAG TPA: hypothetical protein [Caudoviricetes sp.]